MLHEIRYVTIIQLKDYSGNNYNHLLRHRKADQYLNS